MLKTFLPVLVPRVATAPPPIAAFFTIELVPADGSDADAPTVVPVKIAKTCAAALPLEPPLATVVLSCLTRSVYAV